MDFYDADLWTDYRTDSEIADEELIFGEKPRPYSALEACLDDWASERLRSHPLLGPFFRATDRAFPHAYDLIGMTVSQRRKAVHRLPYRDLLVADVLLEEGSRWLGKPAESPERAEDAAVLAEWIAAQAWPEAWERAVLIRAQAFMLQGDARRRLRDWRRAELRFGAAFSLLEELPVRDDHVSFCRKLSTLREDQGRLHEAAVLFLKAMDLHCRLWQTDVLPQEGLLHLGYLYLKQNDAGRAMTLFTRLCLEAQDGFSTYPAKTALGQAICLAAFGNEDAARRLLEESEPDRRRIASLDTKLSLEWLECRIRVHLGDLDRAIPRLEAIRRWLIRHGDLAALCLCSVDVALAYAKQGEAGRRLPGLLKDVAQFPEASQHPWALGSLWWFREAMKKRRPPETAAREAAAIIHRQERRLLVRPRR